MELKHLAIALVLLASSMSGCLGMFGDDDKADPCAPHEHDDNMTADHHEGCPPVDDDHDDDDHDDDNITQGPNDPAVIALNITDADGMPSNTTMVGGNLTFSAKGTVDPDGQLQLVAISITDSNQTRVLPLYSAGQFTDATVTFDVPGRATVLVNALDQRGDISSMETLVFANSVTSTSAHAFNTGAPVGVSATSCAGPGGDEATAITNTFTRVFKFEVRDNATYVKATPEVTLVNDAAPGVEIAICDEGGNAISPGAEGEVLTTEGAALPGGIDYYIFAVSKAPQNRVDTINIMVGYDMYPTA